MLPDIMQAMPQISTHFMFFGFLTRRAEYIEKEQPDADD